MAYVVFFQHSIGSCNPFAKMVARTLTIRTRNTRMRVGKDHAMMLHDHCEWCETRRPIILGRLLIVDTGNDEIVDRFDHLCYSCLKATCDYLKDGDSHRGLVQTFAIDPRGVYSKVYLYPEIIDDLIPGYRPDAFRSN